MSFPTQPSGPQKSPPQTKPSGSRFIYSDYADVTPPDSTGNNNNHPTHKPQRPISFVMAEHLLPSHQKALFEHQNNLVFAQKQLLDARWPQNSAASKRRSSQAMASTTVSQNILDDTLNGLQEVSDLLQASLSELQQSSTTNSRSNAPPLLAPAPPPRVSSSNRNSPLSSPATKQKRPRKRSGQPRKSDTPPRDSESSRRNATPTRKQNDFTTPTAQGSNSESTNRVSRRRRSETATPTREQAKPLLAKARHSSYVEQQSDSKGGRESSSPKTSR